MNRLLPWNFNLFPKQKLLILRSLGFNLPLIPNMSDVENCQLPWKCKWKIRNSVKHQAFVYKLSSRSESKGFRCVEIWPDQTKARPCSQIHKGVHMEFFFFFFFILNLSAILYHLFILQRQKIANILAFKFEDMWIYACIY